MAALTVDFRKHSGPTPADDMAAQTITDCGNFTLDFKQHILCLSTLPPDSGILISKWNAKFSQACSHPCCLCTFSYPISSFQSTLHLICFDTALLEQPLLSIMTLYDLPSLWRVLMIIFWTIAKSAVFPIIVVSKNKIPTIYTVWMGIYRNSNVNILVFSDTWFFTFMSCKL